MANLDNIDDITNITGITSLLNTDAIDASKASKIERELNDYEKTRDSSKYNHDNYLQQINDLVKQVEFDIGMDSNIEQKGHGDIISPSTLSSTSLSPSSNITSNESSINDILSLDTQTNSSDLLSDIISTKYKDTHLSELTQEHNNQKIIKNILPYDDEYDDEYINKIEETDKKIELLDKIDMLRDILSEENVNIDKIKVVNEDNTLDDIRSTLRILDRKNSRTRNTTFAEDVILGGAYLLEDLCDGKKEYFGRRPDLTGWHKTVNTKLMRMRYDTTELAQDITEGLRLGSGARIAIELVPSMFIYSRQRKKDHNSHAVSDEEVDNAINSIDATDTSK